MISKSWDSVPFNMWFCESMFGQDWFDFQPFDVCDSENTKSYQCELLSGCRDDQLYLKGWSFTCKSTFTDAHSGIYDMLINNMFLLVSRSLDTSLCWNLLFSIAHPLQWPDESLLMQSKRGQAAFRSLTDQAVWKQLLGHSLVNVRKTWSFVCMPTCSPFRRFPSTFMCM